MLINSTYNLSLISYQYSMEQNNFKIVNFFIDTEVYIKNSYTIHCRRHIFIFYDLMITYTIVYIIHIKYIIIYIIIILYNITHFFKEF